MLSINFSLAQIEAFACTCETRSLSIAAKRLQKSRTTVSELVETLELNLGYSLFDRTKRPLQLTPSGQHLYVQARLFLQEANTFSQFAMQMPEHISHTLTICHDCFIPSSFLKNLVYYFQQQQIKVNLLNIERDQAEKMLKEETADIGIYQAVNRMINADFKWRALGSIELGVYANKNFFPKSKQTVSMLKLASSNQLIPFINLSEQLAQKLKISNSIQTITDLELLKQLLIANKGWAILPTHLFKESHKSIIRFHTELGEKGIIQTIVAIWNPIANQRLQQTIRHLVDLYEG